MLKAVKVFSILILLILLLAAIWRHNLCQFLIEKVTAKATGLQPEIEGLELNVLKNTLYIQEISLHNPLKFKNKILAKADEIYIQYNLLSSFSKFKLHLPLVRLKISEINIIRDENGDFNIAAFKKKRPLALSPNDTLSSLSMQETAKQAKPTAKKKRAQPQFLIDRLELSLEKATFLDYHASIGQPAVIIFTFKGPYIFKDVNNFGGVIDSLSRKEGLRNLLDNFLQTISR